MIQHYLSYAAAEEQLIRRVILDSSFVTKNTFVRIAEGFILNNPKDNLNNRSNYEYAAEFFKWMISGEKQLSDDLLKLNPWVKRFVDSTNLPVGFSSSYGYKIRQQLPLIISELLRDKDTRRAYVNILQPSDQIILSTNTTHEFPCTIGLQLIQENGRLSMVVNMRSNNVYKVMPYDVYNFTTLLIHVAEQVNMEIGRYYHIINHAHVFKGDARRLLLT